MDRSVRPWKGAWLGRWSLLCPALFVVLSAAWGASWTGCRSKGPSAPPGGREDAARRGVDGGAAEASDFWNPVAELEVADRGLPPRSPVSCRLAQGREYEVRVSVTWSRAGRKVGLSGTFTATLRGAGAGSAFQVVKVDRVRPAGAAGRLLKALSHKSLPLDASAVGCVVPRGPLGVGARWTGRWVRGGQTLRTDSTLVSRDGPKMCLRSKLVLGGGRRGLAVAGEGTADVCATGGEVSRAVLDVRWTVTGQGLESQAFHMKAELRLMTPPGVPPSNGGAASARPGGPSSRAGSV